MEDTSFGYRLSRLENSHSVIEKEMSELASEMKQFSVEVRAILLRLTDVVESNSRIEERLLTTQRDTAELSGDMKSLTLKVGEQISKSERAIDRLSRLEDDFNNCSKKLDTTSEISKEVKYKVTGWATVVSTIVGLAVAYFFEKLVGVK